MVIGVVGGMGSYATLHFFRRYLEVFPAEKEWDRPRIIIDNRCTMPSRVRAFLYGEKREELVQELTDSIGRLIDAGCDHIVLACNTSHLFLEDVYRRDPGAEKYILNILEVCAQDIVSRGIDGGSPLSLIATEGTIESQIYQKVFQKYGLTIVSPSQEVFGEMRYFIEAVKRNDLTEDCIKEFLAFVKRQPTETLLLGCTEFPVLFEKVCDHEELGHVQVFDPLESTLQKLRTEFIQL